MALMFLMSLIDMIDREEEHGRDKLLPTDFMSLSYSFSHDRQLTGSKVITTAKTSLLR